MPARRKTKSAAHAAPYSANVPEVRLDLEVDNLVAADMRNRDQHRLLKLESAVYDTKRLVEHVVRFVAKESPTREDRDFMFELLGKYCN